MNFNWTKALGYGVLLWVVMFVVGAILASMGIGLSAGWILVLGIIGAILAYSFAANARPGTAGAALGYGITFAVIGIILDSLISAQFTAGTNLFNSWTYWLGYVLVLAAPMFAPSVQSTQAPRAM
ncbi:MAG TPA: hypothetical protein VEA59_02025 [Patescibacteria group bacterium]|nr:hypothetical protein [Patescibacteria group bacterium]